MSVVSVPPVLVFADLDDTLFEPHRFAVDAAAQQSLNRVRNEGLPVVCCSSKTRSEVERIQRELGIAHPFICESGAAVVIPRGYFGFEVPRSVEMAGYDLVEFGRPYVEIVAAVRRAAAKFGIRLVGFSDMSVDEVALDADIPLLQARLAKLREYTELFRIPDAQEGDIGRLMRALRTAGLECSGREPYYYADANRDGATHCLSGLYRRAFGAVVTMGFADHRSGAGLLNQTDVPIIVRFGRAHEATRLQELVPRARLSAMNSLDAWADAILDFASGVQRSRPVGS